MIVPSAHILNQLNQHRPPGPRTSPVRRSASPGRRARVRLGHALIAAGAALSGERVERRGSGPALPHTA